MIQNNPRAPRVPFEGETIVYLHNSQLVCRAANISTSGMLLYAPASGRLGEFLRVVFTLPGKHNTLDADALLVREEREHADYAWGVKFLQGPPHLEAELSRFVNRRLEEVTKKFRLSPSSEMSPISAPPKIQESSPQLRHRPTTLMGSVVRPRSGLNVTKTAKPLDLNSSEDTFVNENTPIRELYDKALSELAHKSFKKK